MSTNSSAFILYVYVLFLFAQIIAASFHVSRFGSANVLVMASTVMVPIGNIVFALPFMPGSTPLKDSDIGGLGVILTGLVMFRFGNSLRCSVRRWRNIPPLPWRRGKAQYGRGSRLLANEEEFEWDAPILDDNDEAIGLRGAVSMLDQPLLTPIERES